MKDQFIKLAPLFIGLSESESQLLAANFSAGQSLAGSKLLTVGDKSEAIYLIGQGFVRLVAEGGYNLATLGPGSVLGDSSMLRGAAQDLSAVAATEVEYWKLSDRKLRELIIQQPMIGIKLSQNFGNQVVQMQDYLVQRLSQVTELSGLPPATLQAVATHLKAQRLPPNQTIFRATDPASAIYIIESGAIDLRPEFGASDEPGQTVQAGSMIGALAVLAGKPYGHSAVAVEESRVLVLSAEHFQAINGRNPGLRRALGRNARMHLTRNEQNQAALRLKQMPIFSELPQQVLQAMAQRLVLQHVPSGERVYRSGDTGDALYLIESGEVDLTGENAQGMLEERARVSSGAFFGEMSLLTGLVRTEDATALRNSNLWILYKSDLDALADQYPAVGKALSQGLATRLASEVPDDVAHFRNFPLLSGLNNNELQPIVEHLHPTRFRAGEQIFRMNTPSETLYLIERGQVRIQPISGGAWLVGPGDEFGERSLLTNQPHNATALAETDVDVWTLNKRDFDQLIRRHPGLGANMSLILSQRLTQNQQVQNQPAPSQQTQQGFPYRGQQGYTNGSMVQTPLDEVEFEPPRAPVSNGRLGRRGQVRPPEDLLQNADDGEMLAAPTPLVRRRQTVDDASPRPRSRGFVGWYRNLSLIGKINAVLIILLLLYILGIAASSAFMQLLPFGGVASGANAYTPVQTLRQLYSLGSYNLAISNSELARSIALTDAAMPPTPTWTPPPTSTPASTPQPPSPNGALVNTQFSIPEPVLLPPLEQPQPIVAAAPVGEVPQPAAAAAAPIAEVIGAASAPAAPPPPAAASSRNWDARLNQLGVSVADAAVSPGEKYWKLIDVRWEDEEESGGKHHIFVEVLDENGSRVVGQPITVNWSEGTLSGTTEDKPAPEFAYNFQMYAPGNSYSVRVDGRPSDILNGAGMGDLVRRDWKIHVNYRLIYQLTTR